MSNFVNNSVHEWIDMSPNKIGSAHLGNFEYFAMKRQSFDLNHKTIIAMRNRHSTYGFQSLMVSWSYSVVWVKNDNFCSYFFALIQGGSSSFMSPWWLAQYTEH